MAILGPWVMGGVKEGAKNQLWAATAPKEVVVNGAYYTPVGKRSKGSAYAQDGEMATRLWDWTQRELAEKGETGEKEAKSTVGSDDQ